MKWTTAVSLSAAGSFTEGRYDGPRNRFFFPVASSNLDQEKRTPKIDRQTSAVKNWIVDDSCSGQHEHNVYIAAPTTLISSLQTLFLAEWECMWHASFEWAICISSTRQKHTTEWTG